MLYGELNAPHDAHFEEFIDFYGDIEDDMEYRYVYSSEPLTCGITKHICKLLNGETKPCTAYVWREKVGKHGVMVSGIVIADDERDDHIKTCARWNYAQHINLMAQAVGI